MTECYVFDTEAIIAYFYGEPGHEVVADLLSDVFAGDADGFLADANASEVFYLVARFEGANDGTPTTHSFRVADRDLRALERRGVAVATPDWRLVGEVKGDGRISLADAAAVALASERDATLVVGGDDDFDDLPLEVSCERFRDHGV
ncbi:PIN domain-containing protein [Natrinema thermotolerans]|uniref:PIN domain-containing protein n=1 Tax=Natrinema thermotolerans TaxID=121872 RepID=A0AAF0PFA8_9EURY|nr:PIN domain-containing protein [Natrinema thermotolerans]QCC58915.1 PIN domain-containing protein [Natrinema thermotolerans]WMT10075.1 PIN domain-containing protein [Natrinema thermotolerans]